MSAFIGSPRGLHIGQCQNFIRGDRDDWRDGRYCLAPVIGLGTDIVERDICGGCRLGSEAFRDHLMEVGVRGILADEPAKWLTMAREILAGEWSWYLERAAAYAPMAELFKIRRGIDSRQELINAVEAAMTERNQR